MKSRIRRNPELKLLTSEFLHTHFMHILCTFYAHVFCPKEIFAININKMSGNYTRQIYDPQAYAEQLQRSTEPLNYRLDPSFAVNCQNCFAPYGPRGAYGGGGAYSTGNQIDIDSILRGVATINSKSNEQQVPPSLKGFKSHMPPDCSEALETEYSRYSHPAYDIKGLTTRDLRFDYPFFDPQCQIFENFETNTRLLAKDNHRAIWQIPMNQRDLLPTERLGKVKNCDVNLNCKYAPYNG
jgi:hypothetical protein